MAYSSITKKKCKCGCHRYPTMSCNGFNYNCLSDEEKEKLGNKKKVAARNKANKNALSRKLHIEQNKVDNKDLNQWFAGIERKHSNGKGAYCMECGEWIPQMYMRHATAHLLPKKTFDSVKTHELNYLILGAGCGCHTKTDRLDKFVSMKIWPEAARRIKIMMPLLPFDELKYISSQLLAELDKVK